MNIYLASPFFCDKTKDNVISISNQLRMCNFNVFVPMEHKIEDGENMDNNLWGKQVFQMDINAIQNSDALVVLYYGMDSDSGTSWEQGYAYAINIPTLLINCNENKYDKTINIMNACSSVKIIDFKKFFELSLNDLENIFVQPFEKSYYEYELR